MIQIIYNSLYSYDNFGLIAKTVKRPLLPAKRHSNIIIPGRDGSYDLSDDTYEDIVIPVVIQCIADDFPDLRTRSRRMAVWLGQTGYKPLIFTDEPDKYYLAKIYDAASLEKIVELVPGESTTVNFDCKPFAYSIEEDVFLEVLVSGEAATTLVNEGTHETLPVISITAQTLSGGMDQAIEVTGAFDPAASYVVTLTNPAITIGGDTLVYTGTLTTGQTLIIDCEHYQATKAGANVLSNISGTWPVLAVGNNNLSIVDDTCDSGAIIEITYRKRWL